MLQHAAVAGRMESDELPVRKRRAPAREKVQTKRSRQDATCSALAEIEGILTEYEHKAQSSSESLDCTSVWLALNVVLDNSTFQKTLLAHDVSNKLQHNVVPTVSRAYEESYMRQCIHEHDKPCSMGSYCECNFIDSERAFVGVAFVMPELRAVYTGMCILCMRKLTHMLFYRLLKAADTSTQLMQVYGNICGVSGEYHPSAMLVMPAHGPVHCMPLPVVAHQRNKYHVVLVDGHFHLKQKNVYMEDFC